MVRFIGHYAIAGLSVAVIAVNLAATAIDKQGELPVHQKLQQEKLQSEAEKEREKERIRKERELQQFALQNKLGIYDSTRPTGYIFNPYTPPAWTPQDILRESPPTGRKTVIDQQDYCFGFLEGGKLYSIHVWPQYPNPAIIHLPEACDKEYRLKPREEADLNSPAPSPSSQPNTQS